MTPSCVLGLYLVAATCFALGGFVGVLLTLETFKNSP